MNYYETVYIIHPALQEGRLNDIVNKFHKKLEDVQGKVLYVTNWGKKKLAYPIDKQKYGTYILCQYSINGENLKNISQELELNPNILRYLVTKIDESKILEGSNTLDIETNDSSDTKKELSEKSKDLKNNKSSEEISEKETNTTSNETTKEDDESDSSNNKEVRGNTDKDESSEEEAVNDDDKGTNKDESSEEEVVNNDDKSTNKDESSKEEVVNDDEKNTDKKD